MTSAGSSSSLPCPPPVTADPLATPTDSYGVVFSGRCLGRDKVVFLRSARIDGKYVKFSQKGSALVPSLESLVSSKNPPPFSPLGDAAETKTSTTFYERCLAPTSKRAVVSLKTHKRKVSSRRILFTRGARMESQRELISCLTNGGFENIRLLTDFF